MNKPFPSWPEGGERELQLLREVVESKSWWRMNGSKVEEFEKKFAATHQSKYGLGVTNGTHALELALATFGIESGDEVIIPAFTFISTATAPLYCNAVPVLVDVDPDTFCMDPDAFEAAITERTKAVIPVHMAGHTCDMKRICEIAKRHDLYVIEDAAHAHGAEYMHQRAGSFGHAATFSFQNGKLMTSGEGGGILFRAKEDYERAYLIHGVGRPKGDRIYEHLELGSNYRMNEFTAAVLIAQLERLEQQNIIREQNAAYLDQLCHDIPGIQPQVRKESSTLHPYYMYMFYYDEESFSGLSRQQFVDRLISAGIPTFISYPVISQTAFYREGKFRGHIDGRNLRSHQLQHAENIASTVVWLPHYLLLGDKGHMEQIASVIEKIRANPHSFVKV